MIGFVPMNVEVAASTFENIQRFAEELEKDGIDDFDITLQGSINGGMQFRIPQKLKIEKSMAEPKATKRSRIILRTAETSSILTLISQRFTATATDLTPAPRSPGS